MAERGKMDISDHAKTFEGFTKVTLITSVTSAVVLALMAITLL